MSESAFELAARLERTWLRPLSQGGAVRLERPVGEHGAKRLRDAASAWDEHAFPELARQRAAHVEQLSLSACPASLSVDDFCLAAAVHDLVQSTHTKLRAPQQRAVLHACLVQLARCAPPLDAAHALARHALLGNFLQLARKDQHVSWWAGSASFLGEPVPERLLRWPSARGVQRRSERVPLLTLGQRLPEGLDSSWLAGLGLALDATPLSAWSAWDRLPAPLLLRPAVLRVLAAPSLRRLVLRRCERGPREAREAAFERLLAHPAAAQPWAREALAWLLGQLLLRRMALNLPTPRRAHETSRVAWAAAAQLWPTEASAFADADRERMERHFAT